MEAPTPRAPEAQAAILRRDGHKVTVTDLDTAAYVYWQKVPIVDVVQLGRTLHHVTFYDPARKVESLIMEFANSPTSQYADAMRRLKKVLRRLPLSPTARIEE